MFEASATPARTPAAIEIVRGHAHRQALGALVFDWLSRQAEARTLFSGREFIEQRAVVHQVERAQADTPTGNLLTILERGPEDDAERALVLAFGVDGLRRRLDDVGPSGQELVLSRFARHGGWLAAATPLDPFPFVSALLDGPSRDALWGLMASAVIEEDDRCPAARARHAARLAVLAEAGDVSAEAARARVAQEARDPLVAGWAAKTLQEGGAPQAAQASTVSVRGTVGGAPSTSLREVLRLAFGVALVQWLARSVAWLMGLRREAEVTLVPGGLRVHRHTRLLGRTVRDRNETYALGAVAGASRVTRYPALPLLVGLLALSVGVLLGGLWLIEGIRSGETVLLMIAAGAILVGGGLDLLLSVVFPGRRGRVALDLRVLSGTGVRLRQVPLEDADRFLDALARQL